jgi:hypothetical protein
VKDLNRRVAELEKEKAYRESQEKKAKYSREGIREDKVMRDLRAGDTIKKAASDNLNRTAYHSQYGVQDSHRYSSQSVGQSNSQSKRGPTPAKRSMFDKGRSDPAGTPQNNYSNLENPTDTGALHLFRLPISPVDWQTPRKGKCPKSLLSRA